MSAEAVLAVWVLVVGGLIVVALTVASAVLQRHVDRANARDQAALEADLGKDMAELSGERLPQHMGFGPIESN